MRVVALFRVSTEAQANTGASLESQQVRYRELAAIHGWTTIQEFKGHESATQAASDRRVLQNVLACVRDEDVDAVYVHEQSRLTRGDELEVAMLMRELKERGTKIIVNGVVRDLSSIDERFMVGIQGLVDRAESERIKERLIRGKRQKAKNGRKVGGPAPYGYRNPPPGDSKRGVLQIVPEEAAVVRKIYEMALAGKSGRAILRALNEAGTPAPRGGKWGKTSLMRLIQNPAYMGTASTAVWVARKNTRSFKYSPANERAIVVPDAHEPIVDAETWHAVLGRKKPAPARQPRMLTGLLHMNGQPATGDTGDGKRFYRSPRGVTGLPWIEAETVDSTVWAAFVSLATSTEFVQRLIDAANNPRQQQIAAMEVEHLEDQLGKAQRRLDRLLTMRADGEITKDEFAAKSAETRSMIERSEAELVKQRAKAAALDGAAAGRVVKAVQTLVAGRTRLTGEQKAVILRSIVRRVDITAERTGAGFARDERGRVVGSGGATWTIKDISVSLSASVLAAQGAAEPVAGTRGPAGTSGRPNAPGANVAATAGNGVDGAETNADEPDAILASARSGQPVTTFLCSDRLAETDGNHRSGHLVRSLSCSAPPGPAKP